VLLCEKWISPKRVSVPRCAVLCENLEQTSIDGIKCVQPNCGLDAPVNCNPVTLGFADYTPLFIASKHLERDLYTSFAIGVIIPVTTPILVTVLVMTWISLSL
jgi:hypothetical protein